MRLRQEQKVLALIVIWSSVQFFVLGKYSFALFGDELDSVFSHLMGNKFTDCNRCLWYPFAASGTDQLSLGYTPDFDRILVQLLPGWLAYQIRHVVQIIAAVTGVFIMSRRFFGLTNPGAYFAAFITGHALSFSYLHASAEAFLPLLILTISWLVKAPTISVRWVSALAVCAIYATTTHINFFVGFPFIIITIWFLIVERKYHVRDWLIIFGLCLFCMLFRIQDIYALLINAPLSHRADWQHYNLSFLESLYDGTSRVVKSSFDVRMSFSYVYNIAFDALPFLGPVAFAGIALGWRSDSRILRLGLFTGSLALAEILLPVAKFLLYDYIAAMRGFSMNKLWQMSTFAFVMCAGVGFQFFYTWARSGQNSWQSSTIGKYFWMVPIALITLGDAAQRASFVAYEWVSQGNYVHAYESPVLQNLARKIKESGEPSRVSSYQMYESLLQGYGLETAGGMVVLYSKRYSDFWNKMYEPSVGQDLFADGIRNKAAQIMTMGLTKSDVDKKTTRNLSERYRLNFLSLANVKYIVSRDLFTDSQLKLAKGIQPKEPWSGLGNWEKVKINAKANFTGRTHINVYENKKVLPRFFLAARYDVTTDNDSALDLMAARRESELRDSVIISSNDIPPNFDGLETFSTDGSIKIDSLGADKIELNIDTKGPALLVAGNSYSPYWVARVDNVVTPVLPAYTTFWAIRLPAGANNVTFTYEPPYRILN